VVFIHVHGEEGPRSGSIMQVTERVDVGVTRRLEGVVDQTEYRGYDNQGNKGHNAVLTTVRVLEVISKP